jgi:hypothetical protein
MGKPRLLAGLFAVMSNLPLDREAVKPNTMDFASPPVAAIGIIKYLAP